VLRFLWRFTVAHREIYLQNAVQSFCWFMSLNQIQFGVDCFVPGRDAKYCEQRVCISVCLSVRSHIAKKSRPNVTKLPVMLHVAMAWSSSDGNAICYALPVLWMTSWASSYQRRRVRFVQFARWLHRGRSLSSPTACYCLLWRCDRAQNVKNNQW